MRRAVAADTTPLPHTVIDGRDGSRLLPLLIDCDHRIRLGFSFLARTAKIKVLTH
jgi:hypothetical protein